MKSYVLIFLVVLAYSVWSVAQRPKDAPSDNLKKAFELREQIHKRLMDKLFHGLHEDEDIFKDMDALFEDMMGEMGSEFGSFGAKNYEMAWTKSDSGRTLLISPKDKDQRLEINVENGMISIKGKQEVKIGNSTSSSSFSHSYSVPTDCDWSKVKILEKDGKIMLSFPYGASTNIKPKSSPTPKKQERSPVGPLDGDVTI